MTEPTPPFKVKAIADYAAASEAELSLHTGEEYLVSATDGRGVWWQSTSSTGQVGWFPASYTQVVAQEDAALPPPPEPEPEPVAQPIEQAQPVQAVAVAQSAPIENGGANLQRSASNVNQATGGSPKTPQRTASVGAKKVGAAAAAKKVAKKTSSKKKMVTPPLKSHVEKNKKNTPTTLKIQCTQKNNNLRTKQPRTNHCF